MTHRQTCYSLFQSNEILTNVIILTAYGIHLVMTSSRMRSVFYKATQYICGLEEIEITTQDAIVIVAKVGDCD